MALGDALWDERKPHVTPDLLTSYPLTSLFYPCLLLRLHSSTHSFADPLSMYLMSPCLGPGTVLGAGKKYCWRPPVPTALIETGAGVLPPPPRMILPPGNTGQSPETFLVVTIRRMLLGI